MAWRLVPLCHFFLIEKLPFPKLMSMCEKKIQSILKLFDYPRDCRGEIVWNTVLPETNELRYCFCDRSSAEALKWAQEFFGRKILNSVTDCGDKIKIKLKWCFTNFFKKISRKRTSLVTSLHVLDRSIWKRFIYFSENLF